MVFWDTKFLICKTWLALAAWFSGIVSACGVMGLEIKSRQV
jgi:hypothetical protein